MPWHIEERNGKHCVINESDGSVEKCHADPGDAETHMSALYANTDHKEVTGFSVKQVDGVWNWIGIVSNNWLDKHYEWISAEALKSFVELIDSGDYGQIVLKSWLVDLPGVLGETFKEIGERGTPDLWYWHLPIPIGYTEEVAYDKRGYLIASGKQKEGEFYSRVFEQIATSPVVHGMSHGMPDSFINRDIKNQRIISGFLSTEFTALPYDEAANDGTAFGLSHKELSMQVPKRKKDRMAEIFGEETVERFDALLGELEVFADDSEIPRKENNMSDQTTEDAQVEEVEAEEVEAVEAEAEETETDEAAEATDVASDEESESEEGEEEDGDAGMAMDPATFKVPTDFKEFAEQLVTGLKEVVTDLQETQASQIQMLEAKLEKQQAEIAKLSDGEDDRIAAKAAETPIASMAGWLATEVGSVIGKEEARIHGNDDRKLYNKTKQDDPEPVPGVPPSIGAMITRQRGRGHNGMVRISDVAGQEN